MQSRIRQSLQSMWNYLKAPYAACSDLYAGEENYIQFSSADTTFFSRIKKEGRYIYCEDSNHYNWFRLFNPLHLAHFSVSFLKTCYLSGIDALDRKFTADNSYIAATVRSSRLAVFLKGCGAVVGLLVNPCLSVVKLSGDIADGLFFNRLDDLVGKQFKASMQSYIAFYNVFFNIFKDLQEEEKHNLIQHSPPDSLMMRIRRSTALSFAHGLGSDGNEIEEEFIRLGGGERFHLWIRGCWLRVLNPFNVANFSLSLVKDGYFALCDSADRWRTGHYAELRSVHTTRWGIFFKLLGAVADLGLGPVRGTCKSLGEALDVVLDFPCHAVRFCCSAPYRVYVDEEEGRADNKEFSHQTEGSRSRSQHDARSSPVPQTASTRRAWKEHHLNDPLASARGNKRQSGSIKDSNGSGTSAVLQQLRPASASPSRSSSGQASSPRNPERKIPPTPPHISPTADPPEAVSQIALPPIRKLRGVTPNPSAAQPNSLASQPQPHSSVSQGSSYFAVPPPNSRDSSGFHQESRRPSPVG